MMNTRSAHNAPAKSLKRIITKFEQGLGILLAAIWLSGAVQAAERNSIKDISFSTLPGEQVEIRLGMESAPTEPGSFTIDNPARIALDFPNTSSQLTNKTQKIDIGVARSISAIEAGGRTRVVINLTHLVGYQTKISGNDLILTLSSDASAVGQQRSKVVSDSTRDESIHNIDFRRGEKGEGRVVITLADPNTAVDMQKRGKQIIVNIPRSKLPANLERRIDVIDFATPVSTVDAFSQGNSTRIVINANQEFDHVAYQADNRFTVDVRPIIKEEEEKKKKSRKKEYTGERLSLNFQNIEVRAVLQLIADFTGLNLVTSDTVDGSLTLRLKNVPWDQALDIILKTKGLDKRRTGNVILVAPAEEIAAREKLELEANKQIKALAPLENLNIQVNYAKAQDLAKLIKGEDEGTKPLISDRGSVSVDDRTNKLLVQDVAAHLDAIVAMVQELDIAVRQVLVESRVVLAQNDFSRELGVRFGISGRRGSGGSTIGFSGDLDEADRIVRNPQATGTPDPSEPLLSNRLNVDLQPTNLSTTAGRLGLAIARLPFGTLIDLELSAAQAEGRSETVSSPRVITANQHEALIETGQEIPYLEASSSGAATVAFKKAVLSLKVTPQITPDDRVIMDLQVNKDEADFSRSILGVPPINTQEVQTQVLVDNGETVVLGGVYETDKLHQINRVPFFGDLPIIGGLFRNKFETTQKQELLIFVTPKILKDNLTL